MRMSGFCKGGMSAFMQLRSPAAPRRKQAPASRCTFVQGICCEKDAEIVSQASRLTHAVRETDVRGDGCQFRSHRTFTNEVSFQWRLCGGRRRWSTPDE